MSGGGRRHETTPGDRLGFATAERWHLFAFGMVGACSGELVTQPMDLVKVRMQLQGQVGEPIIYKSNLQAFIGVVRNEGVKALYSGLQPALLRQATYGSLRIGMYEPVKDFVNSHYGSDVDRPQLVVKVFSGALTGSLAASICCPTDVIKVRMQADGMINKSLFAHKFDPTVVRWSNSHRHYDNVFDAFKKTYKYEGLRGLWSGVVPTAQRAAIVAAVELSAYDEIKEILVHYFDLEPRAPTTHLQAAIGAAFFSVLASSPADVVRSRIMNQPRDEFANPTKYTSSWDCMKKSVKAEGITCMWKGGTAAFFRNGPHCVVNFLIVEQLRNYFGSHRPSSSS